MVRRALLRTDAWLSGLTRNQILVLTLVACLLVSVMDVFTDADLLLLYLVPILSASWYGGARAGYVIAVYASVAAEVVLTLTLNRAFGPAQIAPALVHFAVFALVAAVVSQLRRSRRRQQQLTEFIVHDLRSPIASSITGLETLGQLGEGLGELEREMVDLALVSNRRALTLVSSLLDVYKLEAGQMEVQPVRVELRPFFEETVRQVALWAQGSEVQIRSDVRVSAAVFDPELTSRVLVNLLSNALKYSPAGGAVTLSAEPSGHHVRFAVRDEGPGIPPEYLEGIFEPFQQVKGTQGGTGLGLTFCRLAVAAQHGRIWAESQLGQGTVMQFVLGQIEGPVNSPATNAEPGDLSQSRRAP